ncbi:UNVERIFIED_CONTAM: hypothetical protein K2H54_074488 [Gekko kuhli]
MATAMEPVEQQPVASEALGVGLQEDQQLEIALLQQTGEGSSTGMGLQLQFPQSIQPQQPQATQPIQQQQRKSLRHRSFQTAEIASTITSLTNTEKEEGEWSGDETEVKPASAHLFQREHFQRLLSKVISTLNYQMEVPEKPRSSPSANLDPRGFKKSVKIQTFSPLLDYFDDVIREEWANPGGGTSLLAIAKRYSLPEETMEDLKAPLIDSPVVALHLGAVMPKDGENALKDAMDRKNEATLKKAHEAMSLAICSAAACQISPGPPLFGPTTSCRTLRSPRWS